MYASHNENYTAPNFEEQMSLKQPPLSIDFLGDQAALQKDLQALQEKQRQAIFLANQQKKINNEKNIGTAEQLDVLVAQYLDAKMYKDIPLSHFYKEYYEQVVDCTQRGRTGYELFEEQRKEVYRKLYKKFSPKAPTHNVDSIDKTMRLEQDLHGNAVQYTLLGAITLNQYGQIPDDYEEQDLLFELEPAQRKIMKIIKKYIDNHEEQVRQACCPPVLDYTKSSAILAVTCCQKQFHKACIQVACDKNWTSCVNPACRYQDESGRYQQNPLDYHAVLQTKKLKRDQINSESCLICLDPLKKDILDQALVSTRFHKRIKIDADVKA